MWTWIWMGWAAAADPAADAPAAWWRGAWGLDPSRSDDPTELVQRVALAPAADGGGAGSQYAPDGGQSNAEESAQDAIYQTLSLLGRSGRVAFDPVDATTVAIDFGDGASLVRGSKWTKVIPETGDRYRLRIGVDDEVLVVERRFKAMVLLESWLPPAPDADEAAARSRVVVVQIDGPTLREPVEFRRIYRRLDD
ncbi:MAG: hypothetical protein ABMA64_41360 [Myxococcota bacterium]